MRLLKDEPNCDDLRDCDSTIIFIERINKLIKAMLSRTPADALRPVDDNSARKVRSYQKCKYSLHSFIILI